MTPSLESFCAFIHARIEQSHTCEQCGKLCDTVEDSEYETSEAWGQAETREVRYLVSECCGAGVEPTRDGAYGEEA